MQYHTWLGLPVSSSNSQFASGTTPSDAMKGANQLFVAIEPLVSGTNGTILPKEYTRRHSTLFVPTLNIQLVIATYTQSTAAPSSSQSTQTTALEGAEKSTPSLVPTRAITKPRSKSSAVSIRVVFVEVMGVKSDHSSSNSAGSPRTPPAIGRISPMTPWPRVFVTAPGEPACGSPPGPITI